MAREVSDEEYAIALEQDKLLQDLYGDPVLGREFKKLIKKKRPDLSIPEVELEETIEARTREIKDTSENEIKALREDVKKFMDRAEENEKVTKLRSDVDSVAKKFGFTEDGKAKLVARAKEKGHLDWEAHAAAILADAPAAQPARQSTYFGEHANMYNSHDAYMGNPLDDAAKLLHRDPQKWSEDMAMDMLNNPEKYPEFTN